MAARPKRQAKNQWWRWTCWMVRLTTGLSPFAADTDGDGIMDSSDAHPASCPDTDTDNLPDDWEHAHFSTLIHSATDDSDGDGVSNGEELAAARDPCLCDVEDTDNAIRLFIYTP